MFKREKYSERTRIVISGSTEAKLKSKREITMGTVCATKKTNHGLFSTDSIVTANCALKLNRVVYIDRVERKKMGDSLNSTFTRTEFK